MPGSSFFMARVRQIMSTVITLARDVNLAVKANAMEALQNLATNRVNVRRLAANSDLLELFVQNVVGGGVAVRRHAVQGLLSLAIHRSTKQRVAKQQGLVESLSRYGISEDDDVELKRAAIHGVLLLAPLM